MRSIFVHCFYILCALFFWKLSHPIADMKVKRRRRQAMVRPHDCFDIRKQWGSAVDAEYSVYAPGIHRRQDVFCDMTSDGGGWTVC